MNNNDIIKKAKAAGRNTLTEAESKEILKEYGVPVVEEAVVLSVEEAVAAAERVGYPAVLKGLGSRLTHKTERGLVCLNLQEHKQVREAAGQILKGAGQDLEGFLVQPMVNGRREFVAGLFCDPLFGPVVMFGLGGIFTEALGDAVFRVAPIGDVQAGMMLDELRTRSLLGPFRGEAAARREQLIQTITGLSRLGTEQPEITEVDINPLLIRPDGSVCAVDALIVLGKRPTAAGVERPPVKTDDIARIFHPHSIAFIGASGQLGKWGHLLLTDLVTGGYEGEIYLVNAKGQDIAGRKVYPSIADIPGKVDLGVVTLPAAQVLGIIPKFKTKGIKYMLLISSGFSEMGDEGREMEGELVKAAAAAGIVILGPNTMGIINPHRKFYCTGTPVWPKAGSIGLVAQSGNLGTQLLAFAEREGIGIRAFSGSGNEAMITIEDYLHGFEIDDLTKTVVLYIESIKDGRRFFTAARRVARKKPVIVLKGGRTEAGNRAAASHTGAMASNIKIFNAACRQTGVVVAEHPTDLLDLSAAFSSLPLPKGKRVAMLTLGGGWGVVATDLCVESGLEVPHLTDDVIAEIDKILPPYWSRSNPVDLVGQFDPALPLKVLETLVKWDQCDAVIHLGAVGRAYFVNNMIKSVSSADPNYPKEFLNLGLEKELLGEKAFYETSAKLMETYGKPILGVILLEDENTKTVTDVPGSPYKGVAFLTPERAVKALAKMVDYQAWLGRESKRNEGRA
ncbi:MAG: acetate--CoA ligase family protein [Syntrophales bacterium]|jgi:acyl-CoA synthetase (NDP forming)|nr:acetate--CoA ligase family protein [Syntrophales bacterium]